MVQGWARGAKETRVTLDVEIELDRMHNRSVDNSARSTVAAPVGVLLAHGEEASVVALLDGDVGERGFVLGIEALAGRAEGIDLDSHELGELAFGEAIAID